MQPALSSVISTPVTNLVDPIVTNALPTVALVLGLLIVPAIGIAAVKMVYRKAQGIVS